MPNAQLLRAEIEFIKTLPDASSVEWDADGNPLTDYWDQGKWYLATPGCGSAGCLAGFTTARAGGKFVTDEGLAVWADSLPAPLVEQFQAGGELETDRRTGKAFLWTHDAAALLLGLSDAQGKVLFAPHNTIADLEEFAEQFITEAAERHDAEAEAVSEIAP